MTVDGLVAKALGLDDPMGAAGPESPSERTESYWRSSRFPPTRTVREPWREQSHALIRTVSFAGRGAAGLSVSYGDFALPLRDALLDRAFECWVHAEDIADAVHYPYEPPTAAHLNRMIDLAARLIPATLAARRRAGLAAPARHLVTPGSPGRSLHLEIEARAAATGTSRWTPRRRSARPRTRWPMSLWTASSSASWPRATCRRRKRRRDRTATGRRSATCSSRRRP